MLNCPQCDSRRVHPSRRTGVAERIILAMIFVRPFRCEKCDLRFYRWSPSANPRASRQPTSETNPGRSPYL